MEVTVDEKFNPWNVPDLDIYLKYCCPECDSQHDTKDFFIHHALLEHPKAEEVLEYPEDNWERKDEKIESDDYLEDLPSDNLELIEPEIKIEPKPKISLKRKRTEIDSDDGKKEDSETIEDKDFTSPGLHKENKFKCTKCEKVSFHTKDRLQKHRKLCKNDQTCDTCGEVCDGLDTLKRHYRKVHPKDPRYIFNSESKQTCEICGVTVSSMGNLRKHMFHKHDIGSGEVSDEKCFRTCTDCKEEFRSPIKMDEHYKTQCQNKETKPNSKFKCKFCEDEWISHLSLELHIMKTHKKEMFSCTECNYLTFRKAQRINHVNTVHKKIKAHICHHCGQAFSKPRTLKTHLSKMHNEGAPIEKKYKCDQCDKSFEVWESLRRHQITNHDKSVSYQCPICPKTFLYKGYLHAHVKHVHEKYRPNKCDLCSEAFLIKRDLIKHREKHGIFE